MRRQASTLQSPSSATTGAGEAASFSSTARSQVLYSRGQCLLATVKSPSGPFASEQAASHGRFGGPKLRPEPRAVP